MVLYCRTPVLVAIEARVLPYAAALVFNRNRKPMAPPAGLRGAKMPVGVNVPRPCQGIRVELGWRCDQSIISIIIILEAV
jgi:hypothetical protein